jgi:hypothetical protein
LTDIPASGNMMKQTTKSIIKNIIGQKLHCSPDQLENMSLSEMRSKIGSRSAGNFSIVSYFPVIGRGNVLSDKTVSHLDVEKLLDEALRP